MLDDAMRALPPAAPAAGVAVSNGVVSLRVHGAPAGPPPGVPVLLVFGDLGVRAAALGPAALPRGASLRDRVLKAACPVVDVFWEGHRLRVPARGVNWSSLPGATLSSVLNFVALVDALASQSGGAVLDVSFDPEAASSGRARPALELPEGADRVRAAAFDDHGAARAVAWARGKFGGERGRLAMLGALAAAAQPPPTPAPASRPIPWTRHMARRLKLRVPVSLGLLAGLAGIADLALSGGRAGGVLWLGVGGAVALLGGMVALRERQRLLALPLGRVRSVAMGPAELEGRAVACLPMRATYCGLGCVWYRWEEQRRVREGRSTEWRTVARGELTETPFRLDDGTGCILVQPSGADVEVDPVTTRLDDDHRIVEWLIPDGAHLFVSGVAQRRTGADEERFAVHERLLAAKSQRAYSPEEWDGVRAAIEREIAAQLAARAADPSPARSDTPPPRSSPAARAAAEPETLLVCAVRKALPWIATVGAFVAASKAGGHYVDGANVWMLKKRDAREATDTWRNHATPSQGAAAGGSLEQPSTLHP